MNNINIFSNKFILNNYFLKFLQSKILFTYRYNFFPITNKNFNYTSDNGWGCMIRSSQMMIAELLIRKKLKKNWILNNSVSVKNHYSLAHVEILKLFIDYPSKENIFSIHNIIHYGLKFNKNAGDWFGPDTISTILNDLINLNKSLNFSSFLVKNQILYIDELQNITQPLILFIPLRLGLDRINKEYINKLIEIIKIEQSLGFIGGCPNRSYYFIGSNDDSFLYLDPHCNQRFVDLKNIKIDDLLTFHTTIVNLINFEKIDPSLCLGFYIKDINDFNKFLKTVEKIKLFEIQNNKDNFNYHLQEEDDWNII